MVSIEDELELEAEIERCENCDESADDLCDEHAARKREIERVKRAENDPQRMRVGVQGDPTPDAQYGDR